MVLSLKARDNVIVGIRYLDTVTQEIREEPSGVVVLAAGALQTGAIFLRTLKENAPHLDRQTEGLMDTTVVKVPYVALRSLGVTPEPRAFQFNRLIVGIVAESTPWPRYLHGELLNLTSLIYYPLIERMPFDSRLAKSLFYAMKSALGVATLFFPDRIVSGNCQALVDRGRRWDDVELRYGEDSERERYLRQSIATIRKALLRLGCLPRDAVRSPPGGGIHYAGTVPMGAGPKRCDPAGRSNLFANLHIADGAAFPSLPSKSITMSLAAHATRVAQGVQ
jgi:choline dehydrogenase-like flavoprotein